MRESSLSSPKGVLNKRFSSYSDTVARKILHSLFQRLTKGKLILVDGHEQQTYGRCTNEFPLEAKLTVHNPRFYSLLLFGMDIGAGKAYMANYWTTDDLTTVIRIFLLNLDVFRNIEQWAGFTAPMYRFYHVLRRNTKKGSEKNISAHYDLGNEFYALFLDETMTYSCGIFEQKNTTLKEASLTKYGRICEKLHLSPDDRVIEIGAGWGGFAVYAAKHFGCHVTTTTLSKAQFEFAKKQITQANMGNRINLLQKDYRDLHGKYDKLVSIEMIEAVGHHYFNTFLSTCSALLNEKGMMLLQSITIADQVFEKHKNAVDFIKHFIFPGSCIPSIAALCRAVAHVTDLGLIHLEDITLHYAKTLNQWRQRFFNNIDAIHRLGYSNQFIRMWEFYFCYCEAGFMERYIGDVQMLFAKPLYRQYEMKRNYYSGG